MNYIRQNSRCLLLFDNVDNFDLVAECLPSLATSCHVLITTRKYQTHRLFDSEHKTNVLLLETLQEDKAVGALLNWSGKKNLEATSDLKCARELALNPPIEGLPIAIVHAGLFIKRYHLTFQAYWERLQERVLELDATGLDLDKFLQYFHLSHLREPLLFAGIRTPDDLVELDVCDDDDVEMCKRDARLLRTAVDKLKKQRRSFLTWEMDVSEIESKHSEAYAIVSCCSVFARRDIAEEVVRDTLQFVEGRGVDDLFIARGMRDLNEFSLLQAFASNEGTLYSFHHLIHRCVYERLVSDSARHRQILRGASRCLLSLVPAMNDVKKRMSASENRALSLSSHIYAVAEKVVLYDVVECEEDFRLIDCAILLAMHFHHISVAKKLLTDLLLSLPDNDVLPEKLKKEKARLGAHRCSSACAFVIARL